VSANCVSSRSRLITQLNVAATFSCVINLDLDDTQFADTTGAVLGMLAAIRQTLRLAANRLHSSILLRLPVVAVVQQP